MSICDVCITVCMMNVMHDLDGCKACHGRNESMIPSTRLIGGHTYCTRPRTNHLQTPISLLARLLPDPGGAARNVGLSFAQPGRGGRLLGVRWPGASARKPDLGEALSPRSPGP